MKSEKLFEAIGGINERWLTLSGQPEGKKSRRHFVAYELKKLLGVRYLWVFLCVLLALNSAVAWFSADKTPAAAEPTDLLADFFEKYRQSPDELIEYNEKINAYAEEQNKLLREARQTGDYDFEPSVMPDKYSDRDGYSDRELFAKLFESIEAAQTYKDTLQKVIDRANVNLDEFAATGISPDAYSYKYQLRVIGLYEQVRDSVSPDVGYTRGWDDYFAYDIVNVFVFIMLVMLGSVVFAQEKQSGFMPVLRTARYGRARTAAAKIIAMLLLSSVITLMFTATTFAVFGLSLGFSNPDRVIQTLSEFTLSPYLITVGEYFAVTVGVKLLTFAVFSSVILALSAVFYNYVLIYLCGLCFFGLNFLLYTLKYINASNPFKNLNLVATSAADPLFVRYRAINLFGNVAGYVPFMLTVFAFILAACSVFAVIKYSRGAVEVRPVWLEDTVSAAMALYAKLRQTLSSFGGQRRVARKKIRRFYPMSLTLSELFKTLISSRFIIVVLLLLCVKVWYSADVNAAAHSYSDAVYKEYMTVLEGPLSDEKLAYIARERELINETLAAQPEMKRAYINDEVSDSEYHEYLSDYSYAYSRSELLADVESHADYLAARRDNGKGDGWFVYDTGWRKLYSSDADLFQYTAILLLLCGSFASEYASKSSSGGFAQILRATKKGREQTFRAKLMSAGTLALVLAASFNAVDIIIITRNFELPALSAPLCSIELFGAAGHISIAGYLAVFCLLRLAASLLMAFLVCALSQLLCKYIPVLGSVVILTLLPALFVYFGFTAAENISFLNLLAGTPLFLRSASAGLFGSGWSMLAIWIAAASASVTAALASAKKTFVKGV